jgi:hypothetical protein
MHIGNLIKVKESWYFVYPEYKKVIGIVTDITQLRNARRIRWLHSPIEGYEYTVMPEDCLEVICE